MKIRVGTEIQLCTLIPSVIIKYWLIASSLIPSRLMEGGRGVELVSNLCSQLSFRIKILIAVGPDPGKNKVKVFYWNPGGKKYAVLSKGSFLLSIAPPYGKKVSSKM